MTLDNVRQINFGISKAHSYDFGTATANTVFKINSREEIITTSREIIRVDSGVIVNRAPHKSYTGVYCPTYDALITVTAVRPVFSVFLLNYNIKEPVTTDIPLDQIGIYHILFDDRNGIIVTFGNGIKTWYFDCLPRKSRTVIMDNYANIRPRATFAPYYTAFMMIVPCLDTFNKRIIVPTSDGLISYDYDGNFLQSPLQHNNHWFTMFTINPYNKKMLTSDRDEAKESKAERAAAFKKPIIAQGVQYWRKNGTLTKEIPFTNNSLFAAYFINEEFVVAVDSAFYVHIIDVKTMKFFSCIKIEYRPNHIYFQNDERDLRLVICSVSSVHYYNICIPWKLWKRTQIPPTNILRCPKLEQAARIAVQFVDSSVRLFTPYASLLTLCHSANPSTPTCVVVDRGVPGREDRDQVFVVLENGQVEIYSTNECPCLPSTKMDLKAYSCCITDILGHLSVCFGTRIGDIMIYDYKTLTYIKRLRVCQGVIVHMFPHPASKTLLVLIDYMMYRISLEDGKLLEEYRQNSSSVAALYNDLLIVGYENGSFLIERIYDDQGIDILHKSPHPQHQGKVVGLSKGSEYFVSAGYDGSVLIWNYDAEVLVMLSFPLHLFSVGVHNGLRGLLLGTDNEIMFIDGKLLFDVVDPEDIPFDNYDRRADYMLDFFVRYKEGLTEEEELRGVSKDIKTKVQGKKYKADPAPRRKQSQYAAMIAKMKEEKEKKEQEEAKRKEEEEEAEKKKKALAEEEEEKAERDKQKANIEEEEEDAFDEGDENRKSPKNKEEELEYFEEEPENKNTPENVDENVEEQKEAKPKKVPNIVSGKETVVVPNSFDVSPKFTEEEIELKKKELEAQEEEERKKKEKAEKKRKKKEEEEKKKKEAEEMEARKREERKNQRKKGKDAESSGDDGDVEDNDSDNGNSTTKSKKPIKPPPNRPSIQQIRQQRENQKPKIKREGSSASLSDEEFDKIVIRKPNPRNKNERPPRRNKNDPNYNPNSKLASQLIDGVILEEAGEGKAAHGKGKNKGGKGKGGKSNFTSNSRNLGPNDKGQIGEIHGSKTIYGDGVNGDRTYVPGASGNGNDGKYRDGAGQGVVFRNGPQGEGYYDENGNFLGKVGPNGEWLGDGPDPRIGQIGKNGAVFRDGPQGVGFYDANGNFLGKVGPNGEWLGDGPDPRLNNGNGMNGAVFRNGPQGEGYYDENGNFLGKVGPNGEWLGDGPDPRIGQIGKNGAVFRDGPQGVGFYDANGNFLGKVGPNGEWLGDGPDPRLNENGCYGNNPYSIDRATSPLADVDDNLIESTKKAKKVKRPTGGSNRLSSSANIGQKGSFQDGVDGRVSSQTINPKKPHFKIPSYKKRCSTPNGTQLYRLHHIIHVHIKVNREFPPDIDIRRTRNPPCLVYSPEYLSLALGDQCDETTWQKFKRMCCFQGVNDFEFESYTRKKHFVLQNSQKIHSPPPKPTNIPVIELYQTDYDPLNFTTNEPQFTGCSSARSDYFTSARNSVRPNTSATLRSNEIIPPLQFGQTNYEQDFDRAPCSSARSTRSTASKQHWERPLSCFPWLDDEMLRPSSARRVQTPVRIVNPTGKSKQIYRNLVSIFKKVQRI